MDSHSPKGSGTFHDPRFTQKLCWWNSQIKEEIDRLKKEKLNEKASAYINGRIISRQHSPYIIAEISANHNGSIDQAKKTIKAAKKRASMQ